MSLAWPSAGSARTNGHRTDRSRKGRSGLGLAGGGRTENSGGSKPVSTKKLPSPGGKKQLGLESLVKRGEGGNSTACEPEQKEWSLKRVQYGWAIRNVEGNAKRRSFNPRTRKDRRREAPLSIALYRLSQKKVPINKYIWLLGKTKNVQRGQKKLILLAGACLNQDTRTSLPNRNLGSMGQHEERGLHSVRLIKAKESCIKRDDTWIGKDRLVKIQNQ